MLKAYKHQHEAKSSDNIVSANVSYSKNACIYFPDTSSYIFFLGVSIEQQLA